MNITEQNETKKKKKTSIKQLLLLRLDSVLLLLAHKTGLVLLGLEATMTEFGTGVNELEFDGFLCHGVGGLMESFSESDGSLFATGDTAFDHDKVLLDGPVPWEATKGGDGFLGGVSLGCGIKVGVALLIRDTFSHKINLLMDLSPVVVPILTHPCHTVAHTGRMPRTNTGNLSKTPVSFPWQTGNAPTRDHTFVTSTFCDRNGINHLVLGKHITNRDVFLKELHSEINFICDATSINLNFHHMRLALTKVQRFHLGMGDKPHNLAIFKDHFLPLFIHL